jgi:hypothetical protein
MSVSFNIRGYIDRRTDELKERGDALEQRRIEVLKPITVKPIARPIYRNTHIADYGQWSAMNLQALTDYWNALVTPDALGPLGEDDFFIFCRIQHERELDQRDEYKRAYGSTRDTL